MAETDEPEKQEVVRRTLVSLSAYEDFTSNELVEADSSLNQTLAIPPKVDLKLPLRDIETTLQSLDSTSTIRPELAEKIRERLLAQKQLSLNRPPTFTEGLYRFMAMLDKKIPVVPPWVNCVGAAGAGYKSFDEFSKGNRVQGALWLATTILNVGFAFSPNKRKQKTS